MPAGLRPPLSFAPAAVDATDLPGGGMRLRSPLKLGPYPDNLGEHLRRWSQEAPDRTFLAERDLQGAWRTVTYGQTLRLVEGLAQGLLDRGLGPERALVLLSENSVDHGLLQLAAMYVGIPAVPVSPAYSLVSRDHAKLIHLFNLVRPGGVYVADQGRFAPALAALDLTGVELMAGAAAEGGATSLPQLAAATPGPEVDRAFARVGPDTMAKILFTSGSTGWPKGVVNTQRMLCANQEQMARVWPFLEGKPLVLLDWLPWNHTFGGNHNFNMVLRNGGTLYIDEGRPVPGAIERTVANLREVSQTIHFNVPRGLGALLPYLEADPGLRDAFFRDLDMLFYAAAALPQPLFERLQRLSQASLGRPVFMASGWGSTETSPTNTLVHFPVSFAGAIGLPVPGVELKMVPNGDRLEMRVRGPNVTPGYFRQDELTKQVFDEEGFYRMGDAGRLADPDDPAKGLVFDGRVAEDFKLSTGTWVHAGGLRIGALEAAAPMLQDAVVTGHNRDYLGLLAWPNLDACREIARGEDRSIEEGAEALIASPAVRQAVRTALRRRNEAQRGSSTRIARVLLMAEPPSLDANEVTDKGYINQRATLERRADLVERLYGEPPSDEVIVL